MLRHRANVRHDSNQVIASGALEFASYNAAGVRLTRSGRGRRDFSGGPQRAIARRARQEQTVSGEGPTRECASIRQKTFQAAVRIDPIQGFPAATSRDQDQTSTMLRRIRQCSSPIRIEQQASRVCATQKAFAVKSGVRLQLENFATRPISSERRTKILGGHQARINPDHPSAIREIAFGPMVARVINSDSKGSPIADRVRAKPSDLPGVSKFAPMQRAAAGPSSGRLNQQSVAMDLRRELAALGSCPLRKNRRHFPNCVKAVVTLEQKFVRAPARRSRDHSGSAGAKPERACLASFYR